MTNKSRKVDNRENKRNDMSRPHTKKSNEKNANTYENYKGDPIE